MDIFKKFKNMIADHDVAIDVETLKKFALNSSLPTFVIWPKTGHELTQWLSAANIYGVKVNLWGNGTHRHLGGICEDIDITIALTQLEQRIQINPDDLTATTPCGATLADFQEAAIKSGLYLPLDPPCSQNSTIGGIVAVNAYGPRSYRFGIARDMVLGMKVVLADGTEIKTGGQTVKNVAGYDLCKLFIGSMGTLGAITEVTFKLWPLPESTLVLLARFSEMQEVEVVAKELIHSQLTISGLVYVNQATFHIDKDDRSFIHNLLIMLEGGENIIKETSSVISHIVETHNGIVEEFNDEQNKTKPQSIIDSIFDDNVSKTNRNQLRFRAIVPKSMVFDFLRKAEKISLDDKVRFKVLSYCSRGVIYLISETQETSNHSDLFVLTKKLRKEAQQRNGALIVEHAPFEFKKQIDVWGTEGKQVEWMRKIKQKFDRNSVFASGRFVGGI